MTDQRKVLMLVDCHNLCHAVKHNTKQLSFRGSKTGVIYGFLKQMLTIQEAVDADEWLFAWDPGLKGASVRKLESPTYKANHEVKTDEEKRLNEVALPQFDEIRDNVLPTMGFNNVIRMDGFEADDIIGLAARTCKEWRRVIVSRDQDLYQLISEDCVIYNQVKKQYYGLTAFREEWGLHEPDDWAAIKAIAGCDGDNVEGVSGVAEKTAIRYWNGLLKPGSKAGQAIAAAHDQIVFNWKLVALPHASIPIDHIDVYASNFSLSKFSEVAGKYGMKSLMQQPDRWKSAFCKSA